jgi:hypothetical protein
MKMGSTFAQRPRSLTQKEGLHTVGYSTVPQLDRAQHCCHYPIPCSLHHYTLPVYVGRPEPRCPACRNPHQGIPPHMLPPPT